MVRFFENKGILYDAVLQLLAKEPYTGSVVVQVDVHADPSTLGVEASVTLRASARG